MDLCLVTELLKRIKVAEQFDLKMILWATHCILVSCEIDVFN